MRYSRQSWCVSERQLSDSIVVGALFFDEFRISRREQERELKLLAETEANLQQLTDELEEVLASKGQNLSTVAPELDSIKKKQQASAAAGEAAGSGWKKSASGKWTSGGELSAPSVRSIWQQKEEEAQRVRVRTTQPISHSLLCSPNDAALPGAPCPCDSIVHGPFACYAPV